MSSILLYTTDGNNKSLKKVFEYYLLEEGITEDSISFEEWKENELSDEWNDFIANIENSKDNTKCVILGTLGLWDGKHDIEPTICNDLSSAIRKCIRQCDSFDIKYKDGYVEISASHHDGTNNFTIHLLNDNYYNVTEEELTNPIYYKKIKDM